MIEALCTNCGACCRVGVLRGLVPAAEDGIHCLYQEIAEDGTSTCTIYKSRPEICRANSEVCRVSFGQDAETEASYLKRNADACNQLQIAEGLGEEWRVSISDAD
jgi:Fe-S-cluster containining protein